MKNGLKKCCCAVALFVAALCASPVPAAASDGTIEILHGCEGAELSIYLAGEARGGRFIPAGDFADMSVSLDCESQGEWSEAAETLEAYALANGIEPLFTSRVRSLSAVFSGLGEGLYLITCPRHASGDFRCEVQPMLIALPGEGGEASVCCEAKFDRFRRPERGDTVDRRVKKLWRDGGDGRPESVTVQLLRNGRIWDEATLSGENGWEHEWTGLDADYSWRVVEDDVPEGYTVTVRREGEDFFIVNTKPEEAPEEPLPPEEPGNTPAESPPPSGEKLPQTGRNVYAPAALAAVGAALLIAGGKRRA